MNQYEPGQRCFELQGADGRRFVGYGPAGDSLPWQRLLYHPNHTRIGRSLRLWFATAKPVALTGTMPSIAVTTSEATAVVRIRQRMLTAAGIELLQPDKHRYPARNPNQARGKNGRYIRRLPDGS
ncbi:MAG TPA: hypothetical protein VMJ32_12845 [Pirellulales bacterium]|nr:hypothetical protein [Pirellulales bacterium]